LVRMEKSIEIKAPPEKVWEMVALDRLPEWMDVVEMKSAKYTSEVRKPEDKYRVGSTAHVIEKRWEYELDIMESLKNEKISVRSRGKYLLNMTFNLKPVNERTKFTLALNAEMPWGVLGKAIGSISGGYFGKEVNKALEKLKSILEK